MRANLSAAALGAAVAALSAASIATAQGAPPAFQMRDPAPDGDRTAATTAGAQLFSHQCGACHLAGGMGTNVLTGRQMAMGRSPALGLLANRTDLTPAYVRAVVRAGTGAMPRLTRVDVTDAELNAIALYLGKAGSK